MLEYAFIDKCWYGRHRLRWLLYPLALVYSAISKIRRAYLQHFCQHHHAVPVIVIGNVTLGGVGKTPLVIEIAKRLQARGVRVGIVSRGYGAGTCQFPHEVSQDDDAAKVGDEPLLLASKTGCPVVIAPKRNQAVQYLLDKYQSQIVLSDDGLQHYTMGRAIEIVVIDGVRGLGNGLCVPAGPLREGPKRLEEVDFLIVNGGTWPHAYRMDLCPKGLTQLATGKRVAPAVLRPPVAAVAAIGNPRRFFATLQELGVAFKPYPFADHHRFQAEELKLSEKDIVMTEKDAVKCRMFATQTMYFIPVEAKVEDEFWDALLSHKSLQGIV